MRRLSRIASLIVIALLLASGAGLYWLYRAAGQAPEFYVQALELPPPQAAARGREFERGVLNLNNELRRGGRWQARFSAAQINGWLAHDLPQKFPGALPPGASEPRLAIDAQKIQIACRYHSGGWQSVVSLSAEPYLTGEPNVLAIRIHQARVGSLPIPLKQFLDDATHRGAAAGIPLRWTQEGDDPVAIITIPLEREEFPNHQLIVDQLELRDGEIVFSGSTGASTVQVGDSATLQR